MKRHKTREGSWRKNTHGVLQDARGRLRGGRLWVSRVLAMSENLLKESLEVLVADLGGVPSLMERLLLMLFWTSWSPFFAVLWHLLVVSQVSRFFVISSSTESVEEPIGVADATLIFF